MHFGCLLYSWRMYLSVIAILTLFLDAMLSRGCSKISWLRNVQGFSIPLCWWHQSRNHHAMMANNTVLVNWCRIAAHLEAMGFDVSLVTTEWFLCLFSKSLPSEVRQKFKQYRCLCSPYMICQTYLKFFSHLLLLADNPTGVGCFIQWRSKGFVPCRSSNFQGICSRSLPCCV